MATTWSEIVTENAMVFIDDIRLDKELAISPAQYFRTMSLYVKNAVPLLSRPPQLFTYLKDGMVEPTFDDFVWESTQESTEAEQTVVPTGKIGYDLCSVCVVSDDGKEYFPYNLATYDSVTGNVTFPKQEKEGIEYVLDFYTDGTFNDLTETMRRLFGLAISLVWDERFSRNWIANQMKIQDESFKTVNESNYMQQTTERKKKNIEAFEGELKKYEQDVAYNNIVKNKAKTTLI